MIKKSISITLLLGLCGAFVPAYGEDEGLSCEYAGKFQECKVANQNGSTRSIEDFVCISSTKDEDILDQIILDVEFKKIDDQIEQFLDNLGKDKEASVTDTDTVIDDIANNLLPEGIFYRQYQDLCDGGILAKRASCGVVPITVAGNRLENIGGQTSCMNLVKNKLDIYAQVANDTMKINKAQVREDRLQEGIVQLLRTKYDRLISMMAAIIGDIGWHRGVEFWTPNPK